MNLLLDKAFYLPGETVTLTLVGDSQGVIDINLTAVLTINPSALLTPQIQTFIPPTSDASPWSQSFHAGKCGTLGANNCMLLGLIHLPDMGVDPSLEPFTYAIFTATAGAPGSYALNYATNPVGLRVDFFGLSSAPGVTLHIVPEPGTAVLLLFGLAAISRVPRRTGSVH